MMLLEFAAVRVVLEDLKLYLQSHNNVLLARDIFKLKYHIWDPLEFNSETGMVAQRVMNTPINIHVAVTKHV